MIIAITRPDGGVSIMNLGAGLTLADVPAEIAKWEAGGGTAVSWREIAESDLPPTRELRRAWYDDGTTIAIDPVKALPTREDVLNALPAVVSLRAAIKSIDGPTIDAWQTANANSLPEIRTFIQTLLKLLAARL